MGPEVLCAGHGCLETAHDMEPDLTELHSSPTKKIKVLYHLFISPLL